MKLRLMLFPAVIKRFRCMEDYRRRAGRGYGFSGKSFAGFLFIPVFGMLGGSESAFDVLKKK
jgi:hypothetical protein